MNARRGSLPALRHGQGGALWGAALAAMSIFISWYVLGPIAVVLGVLAILRGEPRGKWVILAALVCMLLGLGLMALPDDFTMT